MLRCYPLFHHGTCKFLNMSGGHTGLGDNMVCYCKDEHLSFLLSACSIVLGLDYRHCHLFLLLHLQSSCLLQQDYGMFTQVSREPGQLSSGVFHSQLKCVFTVISYYNCDLNCPLSVSPKCLKDCSTGACAIIVYGSLN